MPRLMEAGEYRKLRYIGNKPSLQQLKKWIEEGGSKKQPYLIRRRDGTPVACAAMAFYPTPMKSQASMTAS